MGLFATRRSAGSLVGRHRDGLVAHLAPNLRDSSPLEELAGHLPSAEPAEDTVETRSGLEISVQVIPIRDGANDYGRLWLFHDATARRDEQRRQRALLELEQQARRSAELQSERLEAYDELRNDFVAGVSHDLRTPLTAIASASELLLSDPSMTDGARDHLAIIHRNADRLRAMVEDLLLVGRLHAGVLTLEPQQVRLAPLLPRRRRRVRSGGGAPFGHDPGRGPRGSGRRGRSSSAVGDRREPDRERCEVHRTGHRCRGRG